MTSDDGLSKDNGMTSRADDFCGINRITSATSAQCYSSFDFSVSVSVSVANFLIFQFSFSFSFYFSVSISVFAFFSFSYFA